jgi:DNA-binding CsgD family transcriptional regulator
MSHASIAPLWVSAPACACPDVPGERVNGRVPAGLAVELVDEDLAVFSWEVEPVTAEPRLTAAEQAVLAHVIAGASNAEIARARSTSVRTIANQVASLLRKLGAGSRFDLIRRFGGRRG